MSQNTYAIPPGGLPRQSGLLSDRARFTEAYAVIPRGTMRDIVTSALPYWTGARAWILARPMTGFAETFAQYIVEVEPGGGSEWPEREPGGEGGMFMVEGGMTWWGGEEEYVVGDGGFE